MDKKREIECNKLNEALKTINSIIDGNKPNQHARYDLMIDDFLDWKVEQYEKRGIKLDEGFNNLIHTRLNLENLGSMLDQKIHEKKKDFISNKKGSSKLVDYGLTDETYTATGVKSLFTSCADITFQKWLDKPWNESNDVKVKLKCEQEFKGAEITVYKKDLIDFLRNNAKIKDKLLILHPEFKPKRKR
jgi:hypothetical protein